MGAHECLLGDVVSVGGSGEQRCQVPRRALMTPDELLECADIALHRGDDEVVIRSRRGLVHGLRSGRAEHRDVGQATPAFDDC